MAQVSALYAAAGSGAGRTLDGLAGARASECGAPAPFTGSLQ